MAPSLRHFLLCSLLLTSGVSLLAETGDYLEEDPYAEKETEEAPPTKPTKESRGQQTSPRTKPAPRKYFNDDSKRVDAGVFHVGFAGGGNFYIEPEMLNNAPTGEFYKDFGLQAGVYFDHDYSELDENIPLMLRGMIGYKYILTSVHAFSFDGMVRRMFRFSEHASFGLGMGASAAIWFRARTATSPDEEIALIPSILLGGGFEFNPFMVDLKWSINRVGAEDVRMGFELYFGFRL